ncbi:nuclear transport factor 2 family protein [Halioxenophilus sp. WMMB6]|uniref:nuclear transport factor 2 family protein n=1 Tax=Halioxenophilus sp. WMMB6 TaxID=3073815 RepID=UPI00295F1DCF|nr:nuclear transport factor 2 family protein [Halioxenophilus sp. WMMB6]
MNDLIDGIFKKWHTYAEVQNIKALAALYSDDALFESPLIPIILGGSLGVLRGRPAIEQFFEKAAQIRSDKPINWFRTGDYFTDGKTLVWEYPRETPDGQQFDVLEVMEIDSGKIKKHRVYMGWYSCENLFGASPP